MKEIGFGMQFP